jgi:5,10-methylenetetrahydrofolate reductase
MPETSKFGQALASGSFVVTCELDPPRGTNPALLEQKIGAVRDKVEAVVVSDNPKGNLRMSPAAFSAWLLKQGVEPVMTLSCRDRNRLALGSELMGAWALGIQNILVVTGDYITWGDHPQAKPVFDLDSVQLLEFLSGLNQGVDFNGNPLMGPSSGFTKGAALALHARPLEPQVVKIRKKMAAGVDFFITHPLFDLDTAEAFFKALPEIKVPILASLCLLKGEELLDYRPGRLSGIYLPEGVLADLIAGGQDKVLEKSLERANRLIGMIRKDGRFRGVHLMLRGEEEKIGDLL